jgi:protein CpxP
MKRLGTFKILTIVSLAAVALAASIAMAQASGLNRDSQEGTRGERHGQGEGWRGRDGHDGMLKGIKLTDDQKAKMKQIGQSFHERTQSLRQELQAKRQGLRQASEGRTFDEALATQKLTEAASLEAKLMGEQFKMHQEMLSVLTPEQKTQLEQKRAEFKAKWAEHRGRQVQ